MINIKCFACGGSFTEGQYVYEVKLDDGKIVLTHGYPCVNKISQKLSKERFPIKEGDWWVRRMGKITCSLVKE